MELRRVRVEVLLPARPPFAGISRGGIFDAFDMLENNLDSPKATTGDNRGLLV